MFAAAIALLPFGALRVVGASLGLVAGSVLRIRRAHVERAMRDAGILHASEAAAGMYRGLGASLVELVWMASRPSERASAHARFDAASRARLDAALAEGRGAVLAASHSGNWELSAAAIAEAWPLLAVTKRMSVGVVDRFVRAARRSRGIDLATREDALPRARAALRRGGLVAMMIDQVPDRRRHGVAVRFLGAPAVADKAPAALAAQMRAPLIVAASWRSPRGEPSMCVLAVLEPPSLPAARRPWVEAATREAALALDAFVRAHPRDWLWMHRRWRTPDL